jgi:hypothetical protein
MKLVHMYESLVRFPVVRALVLTSPTNQELHGGSSMMVATMCLGSNLLLRPMGGVYNT